MRNRKFQRSRQLAANPIERVETRAAAGVLTSHLFDYDFRIGENVQASRTDFERALQRLKQRKVLSYIVVLMADPLVDSDGPIFASIDHYPNA